MADIPGLKYDKSKVYHKEFILKKEGKVFEEYYAVLVENVFVFNRRDKNTGQLIPNNLTMIEVTSRTLCGLEDNKKCYRFPFWIENGKSKYDFKCETRLHRHQWLYAIRLCVSGKPPKPVPKAIVSLPKGGKNRKCSSQQTPNNNAKLAKTTHNRSTSVTTVTNGKSKTSLKRSQSIDAVLSRDVNKRKTASKTVQLPKRSTSFTERTNKHVKVHTRSKSSTLDPKTFFKLLRRSDKEESSVKGGSKQNERENKGGVVANRHVEDSMSDIAGAQPTTINNNNKRTEFTNVVELRPADFAREWQGASAHSHGIRMTLNDRFKSMSYDDVLNQSVSEEIVAMEPLVKSINGRRHLEWAVNSTGDVGVKSHENTVASNELYVDEKGRKTPTNYEQQIVDLESKKEPTENDELDYEKTITTKRRDITELFKATSSTPNNLVHAQSKHSLANRDVRATGTTSLPNSKRGSVVSRISFDKIRLMERANSWAFIGKKNSIEPNKRRENSAPSIPRHRTRPNPNLFLANQTQT